MMTELQTASLYVGANLLIVLVLAINLIRHRRRTQTSTGHGEDPALERAWRAHANATEWTPAALIGLVMMALISAPLWLLHALGALLTIARAFHGWGLSVNSGISLGRMVGTLATIAVYLVMALGLIGLAIFTPL